jgi:hypothetical protein
MKFENIDRAKELKDKAVNIEKVIKCATEGQADIFIAADRVVLTARSIQVKKDTDNFEKILEILTDMEDKILRELATLCTEGGDAI